MTKVRKLKKKKRYQYDVNRKRMNKKRMPRIESDIVSKAWNRGLNSHRNFKKLGLVYDINKDIKQMNKQNCTQEEKTQLKKVKSSSFIKELEEGTEASSTKKSFRFSKDEVDFLTYLMKKYGDDYQAMSRDRKNYLQHTWKKLRYKINLFKSIPYHYNHYLKSNASSS